MTKFNQTKFFFAIMLTTMACTTAKKEDSINVSANKPSISVQPFGTMPDGKQVNLYSLKNINGVEMKVMNYGGIITSLSVPDKSGKFDDVVLGYDSLTQYLKSNPYFGALIGRYGNRIANGKFSIDGKEYSLPVNDGRNHLHGGPNGFDKVYWDIQVPDSLKASFKLTYTSEDGEAGYPGRLSAEVYYHLTDSNELRIEYKAVSDRKTIVNLTQHSYFNLAGSQSATVLDHELQLEADAFLPVDKTLIPTGEIRKVENTPFDFRTMHSIGARIGRNDEQLIFGYGYDHCWVLNNYDSTQTNKVATLAHPSSGRLMEVYTTEPGLQFYSGNFLDGTLKGKGGVAYQYRSGLCLETQHFPDSPNKEIFPSVILEPGKTYRSTTVYRFATQ